MFYGKRTFSFNLMYAIPVAAAFLGDRPTDALASNQCLKLRMMVALGGHFRKGDYLKSHKTALLQDTYDYYPRLCSLLTSRWVNLHKLSLIIDSNAAYSRSQLLLRGLPTLEQLEAGDFEMPEAPWSDSQFRKGETSITLSTSRLYN